MKCKEALRILGITRTTLSHYVKDGKIKVTKLPNGHYDYDDASVYAFLNKDLQRRTYIYARVSSQNQKSDLQTQIDSLRQFAILNGYQVHGVFADIGSGIEFKNRPEFVKMLDDILNGKVERIIVLCKDRLARTGFDLLEHICQYRHCEIIPASLVGLTCFDVQEVSDDTENLLSRYNIDSP